MSGGRCYAYYDDKADNKAQEDWRRHAEGVLSIIDMCFNHEARIIASRIGIPYDYALRLFRLSAALHDIGKVMNIYQMQRGRYSKINYYGHEVIGAYLMDRCILRQIPINRGMGSDAWGRLRVISLVPIMMHHHAMRSLMDWWITLRNAYKLNQYVSRWLSSLNLSKIEVHRECLDDVEYILQSILGDSENVSAIKRCLGEVSFNSAQAMIRALNDWYIELTRTTYDRVPKEYLLMLGPLVVADNIVAHRNRTEKTAQEATPIEEELGKLCPTILSAINHKSTTPPT